MRSILPGTAALMLAALLPLAPATAEPTIFTRPTGPDAGAEQAAVAYIAPTSQGDGSGRSWADAAPLERLGEVVHAAAPGSDVHVAAHLGPYHVAGPVVLRDGGAPGAPVTVRGVDAAGRPAAARIIGDRADPWAPGRPHGPEVLRLLEGADHLVLRELGFEDVGTAIRVGADVTDLVVQGITATNARRFLDNLASGERVSATITGLTIRDVVVRGFSKTAVRLQYDSHDVLIEDVVADSQRVDGDDFAIGVALSGTVHAVTHRRVEVRDTHDTLHPYWNGDGFLAEAGTYDLRYEDTVSTGHTDAGYDLKGLGIVMVRPVAADNKRNYRFWGQAEVVGCEGSDPSLRGGIGTQGQIHAAAHAVVQLRGCRFVDAGPATIVFTAADSARLVVEDGLVIRHEDSRLVQVDPAAAASLDVAETLHAP